MKSVRILSFSGPYFPAFGPEKLRIWTLFMQYIFIEDELLFNPFSPNVPLSYQIGHCAKRGYNQMVK